MGREAGRAGGQAGARQGRRSAPHPSPPSPTHAAAHTNKGSMFLSHGGPGRPSPLPLLPAPSRQPRPPQGFVRGVSSPRLLRGPGSAARQGTAWVRKDLRRLKKWVGDGLALFLLSPQSPTGSRRRRADVREDKGRHGPHQPPVIDGLCPPRSGWGSEASPLTFALHPPHSQVLLRWPPSLRPRGWDAGRAAGACGSTHTLVFYCFIFKSQLL